MGIRLFLFFKKMGEGADRRILHASWCLYVGQRKTCANQFSPTTTWVLRLSLGLLGMNTGAFTHGLLYAHTLSSVHHEVSVCELF